MADKIIACSVPMSTLVRALDSLRYGAQLLSRLRRYEQEEQARWDIESVPFSVAPGSDKPAWAYEAEDYENDQCERLFASICDLEHCLWACSVGGDRDV